jgi:hypothetical protein
MGPASSITFYLGYAQKEKRCGLTTADKISRSLNFSDVQGKTPTPNQGIGLKSGAHQSPQALAVSTVNTLDLDRDRS